MPEFWKSLYASSPKQTPLPGWGASGQNPAGSDAREVRPGYAIENGLATQLLPDVESGKICLA
jgi:hypothetical protein